MKKIIIYLFLFCFTTFSASAQVVGLSFEDNFGNIELSWKKKVLSETESVVILKKTSKCSESISDGVEIYRGNGSVFKDKDVSPGKAYCYSAYVYDLSGRYSEVTSTGLVNKKNLVGHFASVAESNFFILAGILAILVLVIMIKKKKNKLLLLVH